jgi:hypothetical protein
LWMEPLTVSQQQSAKTCDSHEILMRTSSFFFLLGNTYYKQVGSRSKSIFPKDPGSKGAEVSEKYK